MFGCPLFNGYGFQGGYGGFNFLMMIPMFIFIIAIVYLLFKLLNSKTSNFNSSIAVSSVRAMEILDERLAKGEINEEEYIIKKKALRG